jgi:hypothetical protein
MPVFFGFMAVGFLSLIGGIAMFVYVVPKSMDPGDVPRDVGVIFTEVFSQQLMLHNETKRYAAALSQVGVDRETCGRYSCRLTVPPDGGDYVFRLSKNGRVWAIRPNSPVPKAL